MKKLISMTDFVLEENNKWVLSKKYDSFEHYKNIVNYAKFLKQPLTLGMFVPCDENGNVLEEPILIDKYFLDKNKFKRFLEYEKETENINIYEKYAEAKEKVLFKGFEVKHGQQSSYKFSKLTNGKITVAFYNEVSFWKFERNYITVEDLINEISAIELTESAIKQIGL